MFMNSDTFEKKKQDNKPAAGKLLLNFDDDDDEDEEEEIKPNDHPPQRQTPFQEYSKNNEQIPYPLKHNLVSYQQQNFSASNSSGLPQNLIKPSDNSIKSSGLPPSLALKLAALNANLSNKNNNPGIQKTNLTTPSKLKNENVMFNNDEIDDISQKYNSESKKSSLYAKPNFESIDAYSRFKLGTIPPNKADNQSDSKDKPKNENMNPRQKLLEQQKKIFLEKQKMQLHNQTNVTANINYKTNFDNLKGFLPVEKPELDYEKLSLLVPKNESYYEPGKISAEPIVTKLTQQEKEKMKDIMPTTLKLANFSDEEEDKIDENTIKEAQQIKLKAKQNKKEEMVIHTSRNTTRNKKNDDNENEDEPDEKCDKDKKVEKEEDIDNDNDEEEEDDCDFGNAKPDPNFEVYDMKSFLLKPAPKNILVQCSIKRDKSGFGRFFPKYHLYLSNGLKYLMSAKKRANNKTSNYMMSMNKDLKTKSSSYLGKLRSNFLGTEFVIFDTGLNPKETSDFSKMRLQMGVILYESNLLGERGPRKMRVLIPDIKPNEKYLEWKPTTNKDGMIANYNNNNFDGMKIFANKEPQWNEEVEAFVLNFNGRVDKPSVKNFQLVDANDGKIIYMQFGRVGDSVFNLDYQYPFSAIQAFAICLSSFDYKIACE